MQPLPRNVPYLASAQPLRKSLQLSKSTLPISKRQEFDVMVSQVFKLNDSFCDFHFLFHAYLAHELYRDDCCFLKSLLQSRWALSCRPVDTVHLLSKSFRWCLGSLHPAHVQFVTMFSSWCPDSLDFTVHIAVLNVCYIYSQL